jgi:type II secretory pathway pseudopilin PulG
VLKSSKGISLLETLVSILILFFVISLILPQLYLVAKERKNLVMENVAIKILNEKLFEQSISNDIYLNEVALFEGVPLYIEIELVDGDSARPMYTGCITWVDLLEKDKKRCGSVRK